MASEILERLKRYGFDGTVDRRELEEMCTDETWGPFMEHVSSLLTSEHVLTRSEKEKIDALEKAGRFYRGETLRKVVVNEAKKTRRQIACATKDESKFKEKSLSQAKERLQSLQRQKEEMLETLAKLKSRTKSLEATVEKAGSECRDAISRNQISNETINNDLIDLEKSCRSLSNVHHKPLGAEDSGHGSHFLFHRDLSRFYELEEQYMKALTAYTKTQFFDGFGKVGGGEASRYQLLDIQDPETLILKGESEMVKAGYCQELSRLVAIYPVSQRQKISALVFEAQMKGACQYLRSVAESTAEGDLSEAQHRLRELQRDATILTEERLPALLNELASLQATPVVRGDYELKVARQNYFTSKQDQVIDFLLQQRARHEFLSMVLEYEGQQLRDSHRLLSAAQAHLGVSVEKREARMLAMSDSCYKARDVARATLDGRDSLMNCLYAMLDLRRESSRASQPFRTYEKMLDNVTSLEEELNKIKFALEAADIRRSIQVAQLERCLSSCKQMAFPHTAKTPKSIADNMTKLSDVLSKLEKLIRAIIQDSDGKKNLLQSDFLLNTERSLWILFYTDAVELKKTVIELGAQIRAEQTTSALQ